MADPTLGDFAGIEVPPARDELPVLEGPVLADDGEVIEDDDEDDWEVIEPGDDEEDPFARLSDDELADELAEMRRSGGLV